MSIYTKEFNGVSINVFGTITKPLYKVCEVNDILRFDDINEKIKDFGKKWKVTIDDEEMLTQFGVYELTIMSQSVVADEFRMWLSEHTWRINRNACECQI